MQDNIVDSIVSSDVSLLMNSTELYNHIHNVGHLTASGVTWFYVGFVANIMFLGKSVVASMPVNQPSFQVSCSSWRKQPPAPPDT